MKWLKQLFFLNRNSSNEIKAQNGEDGKQNNLNPIDGLEFIANLSISTPLSALEYHGEVFSGILEQAPNYATESDGYWMPKVKSWADLGAKVKTENVLQRQHASDIGLITAEEYLPFLKDFRRIVESKSSVEQKIELIKELQSHSSNYRDIYDRLVKSYDGFPERFFYLSLIDLPGVGEKTAIKLFQHGYHTKKQVLTASEEDLIKVPSVGIKMVKNIKAISTDAGITEKDFSDITHTIDIVESDQKGKSHFLNFKGEVCSTEDAFKDYMKEKNWKVMRAEVFFWQAMFCLSFWEEIFVEMSSPARGNDIPHDLFSGGDFYLNRKVLIDSKYNFIQEQNLQDFINKQIKKYSHNWTRLIHDADQNLINYIKSEVVQSFLNRIEPEVFAEIVYRIAQNPNENRAGVPDFVIWNNIEIKMVEVKRVKEQIRSSQQLWIDWMLKNDITVEVVRVRGV